MKKILVLAVATILLASCVNSYQQNYRPFVNTQTTPGLELLTEGATPIVTRSDNVRADVDAAKSEGYIVVGESTFNGELQPIDNLIAQAKAVKATRVIYSSRYSDTQTVTSTTYVPERVTSYGVDRYGDYHESTDIVGYTPVPEMKQVRNFEQDAVFLVKARRK